MSIIKFHKTNGEVGCQRNVIRERLNSLEKKREKIYFNKNNVMVVVFLF